MTRTAALRIILGLTGMALLVSAAGIPAVGTTAPGFTLPSQEGKQVNLKDFAGKWVVLYFYPKDFTQGCTIEAHNFQEDQAQYTKLNAAIVGVSVDTVTSHTDFCTKENLTFKVLADEKHTVVNQYGSVQKFGDNEVAARNTFIIDPKGVIRKVFEKVNPTPHSKEVLASLAELQK
jgi:thioredoxin-dependent peroxiredoxin